MADAQRLRGRAGPHLHPNRDWGSVACRVLALEPPRRLAYSWDAQGLESTVTFTLEPTPGGTRLTMEQTGFKPRSGPGLPRREIRLGRHVRQARRAARGGSGMSAAAAMRQIHRWTSIVFTLAVVRQFRGDGIRYAAALDHLRAAPAAVRATADGAVPVCAAISEARYGGRLNAARTEALSPWASAGAAASAIDKDHRSPSRCAMGGWCPQPRPRPHDDALVHRLFREAADDVGRHHQSAR